MKGPIRGFDAVPSQSEKKVLAGVFFSLFVAGLRPLWSGSGRKGFKSPRGDSPPAERNAPAHRAQSAREMRKQKCSVPHGDFFSRYRQVLGGYTRRFFSFFFCCMEPEMDPYCGLVLDSPNRYNRPMWGAEGGFREHYSTNVGLVIPEKKNKRTRSRPTATRGQKARPKRALIENRWCASGNQPPDAEHESVPPENTFTIFPVFELCWFLDRAVRHSSAGC